MLRTLNPAARQFQDIGFKGPVSPPAVLSPLVCLGAGSAQAGMRKGSNPSHKRSVRRAATSLVTKLSCLPYPVYCMVIRYQLQQVTQHPGAFSYPFRQVTSPRLAWRRSYEQHLRIHVWGID